MRSARVEGMKKESKKNKVAGSMFTNIKRYLFI